MFTLFLKNWKTTSAAIALVGLGVLKAVGVELPGIAMPSLTDSTFLAVVWGMLFAKDVA